VLVYRVNVWGIHQAGTSVAYLGNNLDLILLGEAVVKPLDFDNIILGEAKIMNFVGLIRIVGHTDAQNSS
jgi:flagellar motor protein MotB